MCPRGSCVSCGRVCRLLDGLDLLEDVAATHPTDEEVLIEMVGEGDHHRAVVVAAPVVGEPDDPEDLLVIRRQRYVPAADHPRQVLQVGDRLLLEGDLDLLLALECFFERLHDLVLHLSLQHSSWA